MSDKYESMLGTVNKSINKLADIIEIQEMKFQALKAQVGEQAAVLGVQSAVIGCMLRGDNSETFKYEMEKLKKTLLAGKGMKSANDTVDVLVKAYEARTK